MIHDMWGFRALLLPTFGRHLEAVGDPRSFAAVLRQGRALDSEIHCSRPLLELVLA